ncbi:MAG: transglutaminase-like domain-containing protein [Candidatus Njordarchaeia archaeon]
MIVAIERLYEIQNTSKTLAVNINILISFVNKRYLSKILGIDGDPKPGSREDNDGNIFIKYRFKELIPGEKITASMHSSVITEKINLMDKLFIDVRRAKVKKNLFLVYPEGLRRIRKISDRLTRKSRLLIDFEEEISNFIERNFSISNEIQNHDLLEVLKTNVSTPEGIIDFVIALHKNQRIPARKVHGFILYPNEANRFEPFYWLEIKVQDTWIPIDPINRYYGSVPDNYLARKIDYTEKTLSDISAEYKTAKKWYKSVIYVDEILNNIRVEKL